MKRLHLGQSDIEASVIALGAWAIGGGASWGAKVDENEAIRTIHAALDAGVNLIDTAPAYGFGEGERLVGKALRGRRDDAVVATKCGLWWDDDRGSFFADFEGRPIYRSLRPDTIVIEVNRSLKLLGADHIDLYQTHWPAAEPEMTPIPETMGTLIDLVQAGKIRSIGVCNVSSGELDENVAAGPVVSNQFRYSMLHRDPEETILPRCRKYGLSTLTYMSLEQGLLTGKVTMESVFQEGDFRTNTAWNMWYVRENRQRVLDLLDSWKPVCEEYACTLPQLVLAWTLAQDGITHVLAGARRPTQITDTAAAADLELRASTLAKMTAEVEALGDPVQE